MLVDILLSDIAMQIKQRMLVEYAAKAEYYETHPDYALHMSTIGEAESVLKKAKDGGYDAETMKRLEEDLGQERRNFAYVFNVPKPGFDAVMRELAGRESGSNDEYVWLCGPSAIGPGICINGPRKG
ncbi:MAG: hypothetical protein ACYDEU_06070 [Vulcanimicrobiaceae bacterium]